ncbi:hypothetical protein [Brucella pituitosa]|uniref:hypothetical protein n=1 Tax=Brucella pituitosa TaxID=571256 RepID=UPI000D00B1AB|nr:hypothetical protein CQ062_01840 [Ochrobactrum sp. MYb68]
MSKSSFPDNAEGLSKTHTYTVLREDVPENGVSVRSCGDALDIIEIALEEMKDYAFAVERLSEGRAMGATDDERISAIYTLSSHLRADLKKCGQNFIVVSRFYDAMVERIEA